MFWSQNSARVLLAGLAAIIVMAAGPPPKVLVVQSTGTSAKSFPVGRSLPENTRITLRAGGTVTLLGSVGTMTLRGPGTFAATVLVRPGPRPVPADMRAITAVVRGGPGPYAGAQDVPQAFSVWQIDASRSGNFCLLRSSDVMLWRPDATAPTTVTAAPARGAAQIFAWPAGRNSIVWTPLAPLINGGRYTLRQAEGGMPTRITINVLKLASSSPQALAAALIKHGCQRQLDALMDETEDQTPLTAPNVVPTGQLPLR